MNDEALRNACTKLYDDEIWGKSRAYAIESLERFVKAQRAEVWREAAKHFKERGSWKFSDYCEAQAKDGA